MLAPPKVAAPLLVASIPTSLVMITTIALTILATQQVDACTPRRTVTMVRLVLRMLVEQAMILLPRIIVSILLLIAMITTLAPSTRAAIQLVVFTRPLPVPTEVIFATFQGATLLLDAIPPHSRKQSATLVPTRELPELIALLLTSVPRFNVKHQAEPPSACFIVTSHVTTTTHAPTIYVTQTTVPARSNLFHAPRAIFARSLRAIPLLVFALLPQ
jgi:hypothetical protein